MTHHTDVGTVDLKQHPLKSLFDFVRVDNVGAGASTDVTFTVNRDSLLLVSQAGDRVSTPGTFTLSFENGAGQAVTAEVRVVGKEVVVEAFPTVSRRTV